MSAGGESTNRVITLLILLILAFTASLIPQLYHEYRQVEFSFDRDLLCGWTNPEEGERRIPGISVDQEQEHPAIVSEPVRLEGRDTTVCDSATIGREVIARVRTLFTTIHDSITAIFR